MNHLDLFSGIGGFALAAQDVWKDRYNCVSFCEIDPFCQAILQKNFPGVPIHADIRTLKNIGFTGIDIITGGFPCQPFSQSGKKRGSDDNRYLWPEMFRVIQEFKPTWIIGENVAGIINMALEKVCVDLEAEGYEVQPLVIPACAVGAPHRRDRVWIIAHSQHNGVTRSEESRKDCGTQQQTPTREKLSINEHARTRPLWKEKTGWNTDWNLDWREVADRTCVLRVDDGLPRRMGGSTISRARWRKEALKAYGNAIVPQVAIEIMKGMKYGGLL